MSISERLARVRETIPPGVSLIAVSKTHPAEAIHEAYEAGQRDFGESRPQELAAKRAQLPADIRWHMIGHLQTNKVRTVVEGVHLIHSVDSERLLHAIDREARRIGRRVDCLLEVHIAAEESKTGWSPEALEAFLAQEAWRPMEGVRLRGLMGIATLTDDEALVAREFEGLARLRAALAGRFFPEGGFDTLSIGMSHDYPVALRAGATMVRVGSLIFGARSYEPEH